MRGFVNILVLLIILGSTGLGLYLVQQKTQLFTQAFFQDNFGQFVSQKPDSEKTTAGTNQPISKTSGQSAQTLSAFERLKAAALNKNQSTPTPTPAKTTPTPTPIPIKTGSIKGILVGGYYSTRLAQANVTASGQGVQKTATTDSSGNFTISDLPIGSYTLSFSHPDYNFSNWNNFEVKEGENDLPRTPNGFLKIFKPTTAKGNAFVDHNGNAQKDNEDEGLDAVLTIKNKNSDTSWGNYKSVVADKSGSFSVDIPEGSVFKIVPGEYTFYKKPDYSPEFIVDGYGGTKEFSFPYYPTVSLAELDIIVFNDKNENLVQDADEENIDYYYAEVTNIPTGSSHKTSISANITKESFLDYGVYNIKLIPGDPSWAYYYKITKGETQVTVSNNSGNQIVKLGAHKLY